ncbi:unnamed protein product [Lota lota]
MSTRTCWPPKANKGCSGRDLPRRGFTPAGRRKQRNSEEQTDHGGMGEDRGNQRLLSGLNTEILLMDLRTNGDSSSSLTGAQTNCLLVFVIGKQGVHGGQTGGPRWASRPEGKSAMSMYLHQKGH